MQLVITAAALVGCCVVRVAVRKFHQVHGAAFEFPQVLPTPPNHQQQATATACDDAAAACDDVDQHYNETLVLPSNVTNTVPESSCSVSNLLVHLAPITLSACEQLLVDLKPQLYAAAVIGLDAEWQPERAGHTSKLSVLQLSIGSTALVLRLLHLPAVPSTLKEILEDPSLIKIGVGIHEDVRRLARDYQLHVKGAIELRQVVWKRDPNLLGKGGSMKALAQTILGVRVSKAQQCSPWQRRKLTRQQIHYAALDAWLPRAMLLHLYCQTAHGGTITPDASVTSSSTTTDAEAKENGCDGGVSHQSPRKGESKMDVGQYPSCLGDEVAEPHRTQLREFVAEFIDILPTKIKKTGASSSKTNDKTKLLDAADNGDAGSTAPSIGVIKKKSGLSARQSVLYENCRLMAPDGAVLCTCSKKKVQWYLERGLADLVQEEPMAVRLKFEPRGRGHEDDKYYLSDKENRCCVCGHGGSYLRHSIVPHCYRQHFPKHMKSHLSHDIVLMCESCHQRCGVYDQQRMRVLGRQAGAPLELDSQQYKLDRRLGQVRSAGRALMSAKDKIPAARAEVLRDVIRKHFNVQDVTEEVLQQASDLDVRTLNTEWASHALSVVHALKGDEDIKSFIFEWRSHFLKVMAPKYMPPFWSVEARVSNSAAPHMVDDMDEPKD